MKLKKQKKKTFSLLTLPEAVAKHPFNQGNICKDFWMTAPASFRINCEWGRWDLWHEMAKVGEMQGKAIYFLAVIARDYLFLSVFVVKNDNK